MEPVVRVPVVSQVEEKIRELIESKKYTEGMKLPTENELCQSMKVGRGTVREALRLTGGEGGPAKGGVGSGRLWRSQRGAA